LGLGPKQIVVFSPEQKKIALAAQALQKGDKEEALKQLNLALILEPNSAKALLIRSKVYHDMGRMPEAIEDCSEILRQTPDNFMALNLRASLYVLHGEMEKSVDDLRAASRIKPDNPAILHQTAIVLWEIKKYEEAIPAYTKLIEIKPEARAFLMRGRCHAKLEAYDLAIADFNEALRLDANLLEAVDARAHAAADATQFGNAIQDYSQYLKLHPRDAATYYNRALSHRKGGDAVAAIVDYTKAIELDPAFEKAYFNRSIAHSKLGQYEQAEADLKKCVELQPCKAAAPNGLAWLYATCPDARFRNGEAAVEWAQKAFNASEGKLKNVYDTMAACYAELGEFEAAVEWEQRYLGLDLTPAEAEAGRKRLELHQAGKPYREEPVAPGK
jgi:tetratricopeptide (TPR) repeat protein